MFRLDNETTFVVVILIALCVIIFFTTFKNENSQDKDNKKIEKYDSVNGQLQPEKKETKEDYSYLYDKKTGMLMSGEEFNKSNVFERFIRPYDENIAEDVVPSDSLLLDDGDNGRMGLTSNMCSKLCCSAQYPVPIKLENDGRLKNIENLVPTNIMCNNAWQSAGCSCVTKDQANFISSRGGNS